MDNDGHPHLKDQIADPFVAEPERQRLDLRGKSVAEIVSILTSLPIVCEDGIDGPPTHAVPFAPRSPPDAAEPSQSTDTPQIANAPPMAPGVGGPNLDPQPLDSRPLDGGAPVQALEHSSHAPGIRKPPVQTGQTAIVARFGHLWLVLISAAIVAIGVTLMMFLNEVRQRSTDISETVMPLFEDSSWARMPAKAPRLSVKNQKGFVNEPLPLGLSLNDGFGGEKVILAGLATGTSLSVGTPLGLTAWQMLAADVGNALVYAPKDFVGIMVAAIDLRSPGDWLMDSQIVRLEWIQRKEERSAPQPPVVRQSAPSH